MCLVVGADPTPLSQAATSKHLHEAQQEACGNRFESRSEAAHGCPASEAQGVAFGVSVV